MQTKRTAKPQVAPSAVRNGRASPPSGSLCINFDVTSSKGFSKVSNINQPMESQGVGTLRMRHPSPTFSILSTSSANISKYCKHVTMFYDISPGTKSQSIEQMVALNPEPSTYLASAPRPKEPFPPRHARWPTVQS